jgi:hypothetical protein
MRRLSAMLLAVMLAMTGCTASRPDEAPPAVENPDISTVNPDLSNSRPESTITMSEELLADGLPYDGRLISFEEPLLAHNSATTISVDEAYRGPDDGLIIAAGERAAALAQWAFTNTDVNEVQVFVNAVDRYGAYWPAVYFGFLRSADPDVVARVMALPDESDPYAMYTAATKYAIAPAYYGDIPIPQYKGEPSIMYR